jgi:hypothetical protein
MSHRECQTENDVRRLREWSLDDPKGWLEFARSLWWMADWGWPELEGIVSTGGWSGNEDIIDVMRSAHDGLLWHQVWQQTRRGGHYMFVLPKSVRARPTEQETS